MSDKEEDPTPLLAERPLRERRPPPQFETEAPKTAAALQIVDGRGTALGDIPNVNKLLTKVKADDKVLEVAYRMCFRRVGKSTKRKADLRKFSGLNDEAESVESRLERIPLPLLRRLSALFDCHPDGSTKDDFVAVVAKFLLKPKASGIPLKSETKKRKRSSSKGSQKKKAGGPKRPLTAYFLYCQERRPTLKKKHPEWAVTDFAKRLAKEWNGFSEEEKKPYNKLAKRNKAKWEVEYAAWEKKQKKKKEADSSDEDDDDDDESDEEEEESEEEEPARKKRKAAPKPDDEESE